MIMRYFVKVLFVVSASFLVCSCKIQDVPGPYAVAKAKKTVNLVKQENNTNNDINVVQEEAIAEVVPLSDNHTIISNDEFVEEPTLVKEEDIVKDEPMKNDEVATVAPIIKDSAKAMDQKTIVENQEKPKEVTRSEKFDVVEGQGEVQLKNYHVVIGSFSKKENAEKLKNSMMPEYSPIIVINEKGMYRVLLISCDEYLQAKSIINNISGKFPDAWVLVQKK